MEKARDGEGEVEKKAAPRKISQTAQVQEREREREVKSTPFFGTMF